MVVCLSDYLWWNFIVIVLRASWMNFCDYINLEIILFVTFSTIGTSKEAHPSQTWLFTRNFQMNEVQ